MLGNLLSFELKKKKLQTAVSDLFPMSLGCANKNMWHTH